MKIAIDAKKAFNNTAGLGQYSRTLINGMIKQFPQHSYFLLSTKLKKNLFSEIKGPFNLIQPPSTLHKIFPFLWKTKSLATLVKNEKIEIYHGLSNELPISIHNISSLKKIVTIHDVIFKKHKKQYALIDRILYHYKTINAVKHADKIIAISKETKEDLIHFYKVPENKITVIYQSCDPKFTLEITREEREKIKEKFSLPDKYILNVSSFYPRKNQAAIVNAFNAIKEKTSANLIFIGNQGKEKHKIENLIKSFQLDERIKILTTVSNSEMPAIYQMASLFIYPSLYEGFGIPILEALNSKIPVITSKGGCFEEVGGNHSKYINPYDEKEMSQTIIDVLKDEELQKRMVREGLLHAQSMSEEKFIKDTMKIYQSL